jgi:hypothetical protein
MGRYQGEVLEKDEIRGRFRDKLKVAQARGGVAEGQDWEGLKEILATIFSAFHGLSRRRICDWAKEYWGL